MYNNNEIGISNNYIPLSLAKKKIKKYTNLEYVTGPMVYFVLFPFEIYLFVPKSLSRILF